MSPSGSVLDLFQLSGKVAIVTGASSGLGIAVAHAMAEAGADVAVAARRPEHLETVRVSVAAHGGRVIAVPTDISDHNDCRRLAERTLSELGRVDILVNNAGVASAVPAVKETPSEFREVIAINLAGSYWMAQAAARVMHDGGSIINVSSALALTTAGLPQAAYSASKAGLLGLTRDLAQQWTARRGIRVNAIVPGFFATEMTGAYSDEYVEALLPRMLTGRPGDPREFAAACVFLAAAASSYMTGAELCVDGGLTIT
jgi:NAD(P)-dependent dehydrogenase (short-subunit alcohol dehydrogenase family)